MSDTEDTPLDEAILSIIRGRSDESGGIGCKAICNDLLHSTQKDIMSMLRWLTLEGFIFERDGKYREERQWEQQEEA